LNAARARWAAGIAGLVLGMSGAALGAPGVPNMERGRALYENHCVVCHTPKVHSRPNRIPLNVEELRQIVRTWAKGEDLHWTEQEITDVVWYLNETKYRY
jgi:mono/diheme cytochrome c family protein